MDHLIIEAIESQSQTMTSYAIGVKCHDYQYLKFELALCRSIVPSIFNFVKPWNQSLVFIEEKDMIAKFYLV